MRTEALHFERRLKGYAWSPRSIVFQYEYKGQRFLGCFLSFDQNHPTTALFEIDRDHYPNENIAYDILCCTSGTKLQSSDLLS
jgi:hypothetical protein